MKKPFKMTLTLSKRVLGKITVDSPIDRQILFSNSRNFGGLIDEMKEVLYGTFADKWVITGHIIE